VPYYTSHSQSGIKGSIGATGALNQTSAGQLQGSAASRPPTVVGPPLSTLQTAGATIYPSRVPIDGAQFTSISQVFRFDVSKEWVFQNWSRKSTGPTDVGLFSIRVPLVMAPQMNSLAGSLTYYFNSQGQVEHISFRGRTGDTTQLVQLLTTTYGLRQVEGPTGEKLYQLPYKGGVQSELRTKPESIMWSNSPNQSIALELELARPGSERVLPPRPTGFEPLQAATAQAAASSSPPASSTTEAKPGATESKSYWGSYFDKVRHATPQEQTPLLQNRWPQ